MRASATWGECLNYRGGPSQVTLHEERRLPTPAPLGILDTLPRLRSLLQTKMAAVQSKLASLENPTEKWGTVNRVLHIMLQFFTIMLMLDAQKISLLCSKGVTIMLHYAHIKKLIYTFK